MTPRGSRTRIVTIRMSSVVSSSYATSPQVSADHPGRTDPGLGHHRDKAAVNAPKIRLFSFWCQGGSRAPPTESRCAFAHSLGGRPAERDDFGKTSWGSQHGGPAGRSPE